jgi:putative transposon-encoded protein
MAQVRRYRECCSLFQPLVLADLADFQRHRHVVQHRAVRQQREILKHHADLAVSERLQSFGPSAMTSVPSIMILPAVGSSSRLKWRTSVDLPLPDKPMMQKISPRR